MLEDIRNRAYTRLQQALADGDEKKAEAFDSLYEALKDGDYLIKKGLSIASDVLDALEYEIEEIKQVLDYLLHKDDIKVLLEFVDVFGEFIKVETIINPKIEKLYKFENDMIFKHNLFLNRYYYLSDGEWVRNASISSKICDFRYSYKPLGWKIANLSSPNAITTDK